MNKRTFAILFLLSGLCGLMYQILWTRLFSEVLGNTYAAISIIVAAFMGGLFVGAWQIGRFIDRLAHELRWYAILEITIGGAAVLLLGLFPVLPAAYGLFHAHLQALPLANYLVKFLFTFLLIGIPTGAMGATLPLAVQYFTRRRHLFGENISLFYAVNTVGGALGVVAAGFYVIEYLGVRGGILVTAAMNLLIGGVVLWRIRGEEAVSGAGEAAAVGHSGGASGGPKHPKGRSPRPDKRPKGRSLPPGSARKLLYLSAAGLGGFAALAYEIIWTRGVKFLSLNSTYGFSTILFVFLVGIALGAAIARRLSGDARRMEFLYGLFQMGVGIYAIVTVYLLYNFYYTDFFQRNVVEVIFASEYGWGLVILMFLVIGMLTYLLPSVLMGILFPLINDLYFAGASHRPGKTVSIVYAVNTIGSITGALGAGFILIPALGLRGSLYLIAGINLLLGLVFVLVARHRLVPVLMVGLPLLLAASYLSGDGRYLRGRHERETDRVLFYKEGLMATVKVTQRKGIRAMSIDGVEIARSGGILLQKEQLIGHLPFFFHPNIEDVLVVGLASGISTGSIALHPSVKRVDCVELIRPVFDAARLFSRVNHNIFNNPRVHLIHDDVYSFLMYNPRRYDMICSDGKIGSLNSGNTIMLAYDYYELCRKRLKPGGLFIQWVPVITPAPVFQVILNTLKRSFKHVALFYFYHADIFMIASDEEIVLDKELMDRVFQVPQVEQELRRFQVRNALAVFSAYVGEFHTFPVDSIPVNSFDRPVLEFRYLREWKRRWDIPGGHRALNLQFLADYYQQTPVEVLFRNCRNPEPEVVRQKIYQPTLKFLRFAIENFKYGNYVAGLREYRRFKESLSL